MPQPEHRRNRLVASWSGIAALLLNIATAATAIEVPSGRPFRDWGGYFYEAAEYFGEIGLWLTVVGVLGFTVLQAFARGRDRLRLLFASASSMWWLLPCWLVLGATRMVAATFERDFNFRSGGYAPAWLDWPLTVLSSPPVWVVAAWLPAARWRRAYKRGRLRLDRAAGPPVCGSCGYDLSGLPRGSSPLPCPECGAAPKS